MKKKEALTHHTHFTFTISWGEGRESIVILYFYSGEWLRNIFFLLSLNARMDESDCPQLLPTETEWLEPGIKRILTKRRRNRIRRKKFVVLLAFGFFLSVCVCVCSMISRAGMPAAIARDYYYTMPFRFNAHWRIFPSSYPLLLLLLLLALDCVRAKSQGEFPFRSPGNRLVCSTSTITTLDKLLLL
jgi:hypothetical protein